MGDFVNSCTLCVSKTLLSTLLRREVPNSEEVLQVKSPRRESPRVKPLVKSTNQTG